jgi:hypothetical protein
MARGGATKTPAKKTSSTKKAATAKTGASARAKKAAPAKSGAGARAKAATPVKKGAGARDVKAAAAKTGAGARAGKAAPAKRTKAAEKAAPAKKATATKKVARRAAKQPDEAFDIEKELTVDNLLARARDQESERIERAARERENTRKVRPPTPVRPANPVHWGYPYCFDKALPAGERAELRALFERFTRVAEESRSGYYVVGPETEPETRRAAWDAGGVVLEVEQLRAQLPPADEAGRRERLLRALERPTSEGWFEAAMLLSTWDAATLPAAIAEAERLLARWPDELRSMVDTWRERPELRGLVRVQHGEISADGPADGVTVVHTQAADDLAAHHERFAATRTLDISGRPGLPELVAGCTGLVGLERLIMMQPTYTSGTAKIDLAALLAAPHLQRLTGLSLYGYSLSDDDLEALADCPQPLEHLRIEYASMKPKAGEALARLAARKRLRTLDLKYNDLGPKGAASLFGDPESWRALRVLDISANEIGDRGVEALAGAGLGELRWLNLSSNDNKNQLTPKAARALAESRSLGQLETLIVHGHPIGAEGVAALLYSPQLHSLRRLNAAFPSATLADIVARCGDGEPVPIVELNLGHLDSPAGGKKKSKLDLSRATFLRTVRSLSLDSLDGSEYAPVLNCPHLGSLEVLILGGGYSNQNAAFAALCSATPPPRLRYLSLSGWKLTPEQAREFAASPLGQALWGVDLMASYTVPDAWYELYYAGLPTAGSPFFDAFAPNEHVTTTTFREEI